MSRNNPSELHLRAQQDSTMPPPSSWPRREDQRPAPTHRTPGKGRGEGPHLQNLKTKPSKHGVNTLLNHRASRTEVKVRAWYRSKAGAYHKMVGPDEAKCGARIIRTAGPMKAKELRDEQMCHNCRSGGA